MRNCAVLLLAAGVLSSANVLADAEELSIFHSIAIDAPADEVWAMPGAQRWIAPKSPAIAHTSSAGASIAML